MATKQQVRRALEKQGGHWDEAFDTFDAPAGMNWLASSCHSIAVAWDEDLTASENWDGHLDQINSGTYPCDLVDCDMCEEQRVG